MFREEVKLKDGFVKTVVADNEQELAEGVAAVKNDTYPVSPDLHNPSEPNAVVSPDNLHTEPAPVFLVEEPEPEPEKVEVKFSKSKK